MSQLENEPGAMTNRQEQQHAMQGDEHARQLTQLVAERLSHVKKRLLAATPGRNLPQIVAVTKGCFEQHIQAALANGLCDFGENYADELKAKSEKMKSGLAAESTSPAAGSTADDIRWHFQGRLQSNKIARLDGIVSVWQSLDNLSTAEKLAKRIAGADVFVEVRTSQDDSRPGVEPSQIPEFVERCRLLQLNVRGLMCIASLEPAEAAREFELCRRLGEASGLSELSMGMSQDYELAAQNGATMVRLGRILFDPDFPIRH